MIIRLLKSIFKIDSKFYFRRGNIYTKRLRKIIEQLPKKAIENYTKAIELNPNFISAFVRRGIIYAKSGEYNKAIEDFTMATYLNPNNFKAYFYCGLVYLKIGKYKRAIESFSKAIQANSNFSKAYFKRGVAYFERKEYDKAIEDFNAAINLKSDFAEAMMFLGRAYQLKEDYEKAKHWYYKTLKNKENLKDWQIDMVFRWFKELKYQVDLGDYMFYYKQGREYSGKMEWDKAIENLTMAIEINPCFEDAYTERAYIYAFKGEYDKAIEDYSTILRFRPNDYYTLRHLREMYAMKHNFIKYRYYKYRELENKPDFENYNVMNRIEKFMEEEFGEE